MMITTQLNSYLFAYKRNDPEVEYNVSTNKEQNTYKKYKNKAIYIIITVVIIILLTQIKIIIEKQGK
jgi:hypothetical protein